MPHKYVTVDGVATYVHHRGPTTLPGTPPDLSRGPAVLCAHGAGGNGHEFAEVLDSLDGDFSPIAYDQPGHGRSGSLDSLGTIEAMAGHLRGVAASLAVTRPVLVGHGMGAAVTLEATASEPDFPRALVLTGGAAVAGDISDDAINQLRRVVEGKDRRAFDPTGYAPETPREIYQRAFSEWVKTDPRVTLGDRVAEQAWDRRSHLDAVSVPALVVVGEFEEPGARKAAEELAGELPDGRLISLAGAGRHALLERPRDLTGVIVSFLKELPR